MTRADVCIVGAGAAGCVLAARLSEHPERTVVLVEAGPDYGHFDEGRWPADLLDASDCATSHDWGYGTDVCCRVVGGCSAHNGCLVVRGTADDYDGWARAAGDPRWGADAMRPYLDRAEARIETRSFADDEVGSFTRRALDGWAEAGVPRLQEFNAGTAIAGAGLMPVNRRGRLRVGAALAYLDPARGRPNLTILADTMADRIAIRDGRAVGVHVGGADGRASLVEADEILVAAGAYGSPAILLRSGVGPAGQLAALGIDPVADVAGVGENLQDHPAVHLWLEVSPMLAAELRADDARGILTHVQASLKAASSHCPAGTFDLQLYPNVAWADHGHQVSLIPIQLAPRARGTVRLRSADPAVVPEIDQRLFRDDGGHDLEVLLEGVGLARELAGTAPIASVTGPPPHLGPDDVRAAAFTLFHPCGTCAMSAVVDAGCRVLGVDRLRVCDASVFPAVPRANTHLSVLALAEAVADQLGRGPDWSTISP